MTFHVAYSSTAGKSRIHWSTCPHCRAGAVHHDADMPISWSPTLNTLSEAESYAMRMFPEFRDKGKCNRCMSGDFVSRPYWLTTLQDWMGHMSNPAASLPQRRK